MTLTAAETKTELVKWLAIEENAKRILTEFFNSTAASNEDKKLFYSSLHDNQFAEGFPTVVVDLITSSTTGVTSAYPIDYKTYTIKLRTTTQANISAKTSGGGGATTRTVYEPGMIIEFNTLFSFGEASVEFVNTDDSKYSMLLAPTFGTGSTKSTSIAWTSTGTAPSIVGNSPNSYKKGNYPVKFYAVGDLVNPVITDSILLASRIQGVTNTNYTFIPTYNII